MFRKVVRSTYSLTSCQAKASVSLLLRLVMRKRQREAELFKDTHEIGNLI